MSILLNRILFVGFLLLLYSHELVSQYERAIYDSERNYFNEGKQLPAETYFIIKGKTEEHIELIELALDKAGRTASYPLHRAYWKRTFQNSGVDFEIPVNYPLSSNSKYDITLTYFEEPEATRVNRLRNELVEASVKYVFSTLDSHTSFKPFQSHSKRIFAGLNELIREKTKPFVNKTTLRFNRFSPNVFHLIHEIHQADKKNVQASTISLLKLQLANELEMELKSFLSSDVLVVAEIHTIDSYRTEKTKNSLALNLGYSASLLDSKNGKLSFDTAPFIGFSFPLSRSTLAPSFFKNTSFSLGILLTNLEDEEENKVSGPLIGRPMYFALGYKTLQFIRLNAGLNFLTFEEDQSTSTKLGVRPFVGLSLEFSFWIGLDKK